MKHILSIMGILTASAGGCSADPDTAPTDTGGPDAADAKRHPAYVGTSVPGTRVEYYLPGGSPLVAILGKPPSGFLELVRTAPAAAWATATGGRDMPADIAEAYTSTGTVLGAPTVIEYIAEDHGYGNRNCDYDWQEFAPWLCEHGPETSPPAWCSRLYWMRGDTTREFGNEWAKDWYKETYVSSLCQRSGNGKLSLYKYDTITQRSSVYETWFTETMPDEDTRWQEVTLVKADYQTQDGEIRWWGHASMSGTTDRDAGDVVFYAHVP
jgi:hypothetical protein